MAEYLELDPKRPWRWKNWRNTSVKDKIWILLLSSELFWSLFIFFVVLSVVFAILLGNHLVPQTGVRHIFEIVFFVALVSVGLLFMLAIFEVTFHLRDFVCHRILKNR